MACVNHPDVDMGVEPCSLCRKPFCPDCLVELRGRLHCADCKLEQVRDIQSGAVGGRLLLAGLGARFAAQVIDWLVFGVLWIPMILIFAKYVPDLAERENPFSFFAFYMAFLFGLGLVPVLYEAFLLQARGQTLGKMALRIKVVTPEGNDISTGQSWGRALLRILMFSVCYGIPDWIPIFFTRDKTCVHDLGARTRVIRLSSTLVVRKVRRREL